MTKVIGKDGVAKMLSGAYAPDQVFGFAARGRDTEQLRTPGTTSGGIPEWYAGGAPIMRPGADLAHRQGRQPALVR